MAPQNIGGSKTQKNKPPNVSKVSSQTPTKFLVCISITIRVQRWFVELQVAFL